MMFIVQEAIRSGIMDGMKELNIRIIWHLLLSQPEKYHLIDFPENNISIESFYDRLRPCYDSIMQFSDRVLVAQMNWNGMLEGAVYGFVEDPEEGWSPIECRLELLKISDETYTDAGHAIEWCIRNAH